MADPPLLDGGVKATVASVLPGVTIKLVGAFGVPSGVEIRVVEVGLGPTALIARSPIV
jgi:hypothetical protein